MPGCARGVPASHTISFEADAAGIIFDATVIRALFVPSLMSLRGDANWWMPKRTSTLLRTPHREPAPEIAVESTYRKTDAFFSLDARRARRRSRS